MTIIYLITDFLESLIRVEVTTYSQVTKDVFVAQVDKRVQKSIEDLGITAYRRCTLVGWTISGSLISAVKLLSPKKELVLPCFALFYYGVNGMDLRTFKAIVQSGLVYDGGTVISTEFQTNDPHVFAAGPSTRIERAARARHRKHSYYHSEDVGEALGQLFLKKFDPYFIDTKSKENIAEMEFSETTSSSNLTSGSSLSYQHMESALASWEKRWRPAPTYDSPIWVAATLPGPLYYLKVRPPGPEMPMEVQLSLPKKGHILVTDRDGNYFRLQLSGVHRVSAVTCLSHKQFASDQLVQLYGKHESLFHHLLRRFSMSLIDDLFCYFSQPWMSALYQEAFVEALADIDEPEMYAQNKNSEDKKVSFREKVRDIVGTAGNEQLNCTENAWMRLRAEVRSLWSRSAGERNVLDHIGHYLHDRGADGDRYSTPILRQDFYGCK